MVQLYPVVNLTDPNTFDAWRNVPTDALVVRLRDLVNPRTLRPNAAFRRIRAAGGLRKFLQWDGTIILSLVMKDEHLIRFYPARYAYFINSLHPDYYTTVDGETYNKTYALSRREIRRVLQETVELMQRCPGSTPIGHVKGCTPEQIKWHAGALASLGIKTLMLHAGDFLRRGQRDEMNRAREYAQLILPYAETLLRSWCRPVRSHWEGAEQVVLHPRLPTLRFPCSESHSLIRPAGYGRNFGLFTSLDFSSLVRSASFSSAIRAASL